MTPRIIAIQWSKFRTAKGLSDTDPAYLAMTSSYKDMMNHPHHPHHFAPDDDKAVARPEILTRAFDLL